MVRLEGQPAIALYLVEAIARHVADLYREKGSAASVREIARHCGLKSSSTVQARLRAAAELGLIRRVQDVIPGGKAVWIPVVPDGCCPMCSRPLA